MPAGEKFVVTATDPPSIVTGDVTIVPTLVFELVTLKVTGAPPAIASFSTKFPKEFSSAADSVSVVGGALRVVVKSKPKPNGPAITIPERPRVTVPEAVPNPVIVAEYVTVPVLSNPCT